VANCGSPITSRTVIASANVEVLLQHKEPITLFTKQQSSVLLQQDDLNITNKELHHWGCTNHIY